MCSRHGRNDISVMCSRHGRNEFWSENLATRGHSRGYGIDKGWCFFMSFATLQQETTVEGMV